MQPKIVNIKDKHLLGISCRMSVNNNKTPELWKKFMNILHTISSNKPQEFIALQVYEASYFYSRRGNLDSTSKKIILFTYHEQGLDNKTTQFYMEILQYKRQLEDLK